jgi:hypothetical protein
MMVIFKNPSSGSPQAEIMTTALDLVKTAAALASDTTTTEPLLDQAEAIVSSAAGSLLSVEEENSLFAIYLQLEQYLITADPIRKFDKEELRNKASRSLRMRLEAYENGTIPASS